MDTLADVFVIVTYVYFIFVRVMFKFVLALSVDILSVIKFLSYDLMNPLCSFICLKEDENIEKCYLLLLCQRTYRLCWIHVIGKSGTRGHC